jgi:hypothetical protein
VNGGEVRRGAVKSARRKVIERIAMRRLLSMPLLSSNDGKTSTDGL